MLTPKHLIAIARSNNTAALGNVISEMAKNEACRLGAWGAQRDRRYKPKAATQPEKIHVIIPGITPDDAIAYSLSVTKITLPLFKGTNEWESKHSYNEYTS